PSHTTFSQAYVVIVCRHLRMRFHNAPRQSGKKTKQGGSILFRIHRARLYASFVGSAAISCTFFLAADAPAQNIRNPYHKQPQWRIWSENPEPVEAKAGQNTLKAEPVPRDKRQYPDLSQEWLESRSGAPALKDFQTTPTVAGSWDDAYLSLDNGHTNLRQPRDQFIFAGKVKYESFVNVLHQLGINFTSQSYALRGRHIVDDTRTLMWTEMHYSFANIVRASPAHASYKDQREEMVDDAYDGLFSHSYQSVGQSGSEIHALYKMMMAGACMDRKLKDQLKQNGLYALVLMSIFKQALPYADSEGEFLPYSHELRHRPAYSSSGNLDHPHFAPANPYYHSYNEDLHIYAMCRLASQMKTAPPVTILKLESVELENSDRATSATEAVVSGGLTSIRIWGKPGETIRARVDLNNCYTLDGRPFQVHADHLYPEHNNITIQAVDKGIVEVVAKHDPNLPKQRQPVLFYATNESNVASNPAFLNFYWPEEKEISDWPSGRPRDGEIRQAMNIPVNVNKRPVIAGELQDKTRLAKVGDEISVDLTANDPEGFPVEIFRYQDEGGTLNGTNFSFQCGADTAGKALPFHFVFSDQTGAYNGFRLKVLVQEQENESQLSEGWSHTVLGNTRDTGLVMMDGDSLMVRGGGAKDGDGVYAWRWMEGDFDWRLPMVGFETGDGENTWAIMLRGSLKDFAKQASIEIMQKGDERSGAWRARPTYSRWARNRSEVRDTRAPRWLRMIRRGDIIAGFVSNDGKTWEQVQEIKIDLPRKALLGVMVRSESQATLRTDLAETFSGALPLLRMEGKTERRKPDVYLEEAKLTVDSPEGIETKLSIGDRVYSTSEPITINEPGDYMLKLEVLSGPDAGNMIRSRFTVIPKPEEKPEN
ncbi:MAG: hypothetical protein ACOCVL_01705, partial [Candidatus Sumerlaeota bacterium]